ncbi:MAG: DUF1343 domain-containing protein [Bacteroidota bacterium]|nr:DUF1343 domain-containing protein [Bacteroidota bacterium]
MIKRKLFFFLIISLSILNLKGQNNIRAGAERMDVYLPVLKGKNIAILGNNSSLVNGKSLVDTLLSLNINIKKIFSPEHGFRGIADAGEHIGNYIDKKTKLPVISMYGKNFKPKVSDLKGIDIVVFDIQDVGVRFYTYTSSMHYMMEACCQAGIDFLVLDRPNPNGFYVDGPVLKKEYKSFIGLHPVALVHGMTVAEYAKMINEEGWLKGGKKCNLKYIPVENYTHSSYCNVQVNPSPNLQNLLSIYLYPSLGLLEGTNISVGRGTDMPFQIFGHPAIKNTGFSFTPRSINGASKTPPYEGLKCNGFDLRKIPSDNLRKKKKISLEYLMSAYKNITTKENFFNDNFNLLAGNNTLKQQIINNIPESEIRKTWEEDLNNFKKTRKKYLLYPDFE